MSDQTENTPYYQGRGSGKNKEQGCDPPPPPPPPTCPDPCDKTPPWGPPDIRPDCCPKDDRACCPEEDQYCTWDEVEDPCVRASSCVADDKWTKIECTCKSSNEKCTCDEWDCGCYPQGTCVPCNPCEGLIPDGPNGGSGEPNGGTEPDGDSCVDELRKQLNSLRKDLSTQQSEKTTIEAKIQAGQEREKALAKLVEDFSGVIDKYTTERHKLLCREDCLKIFHRDTAKVFEDKQKFPETCLKDFRNAINAELCRAERAKCCKKNLEGKLEKVTKLIWEQKQAETTFGKADDAFKAIKDFPKWVGDQFTPLEALRDQIQQALNDKDPLKQRWAFYLFYWRFVPGLCKRFTIAICCKKKGSSEEAHHQVEQPTDRIGCERGDWHPSIITVEKLTALICCAAENAQSAKDNLQTKTTEVEKTKLNLELIKKTIPDAKALEDLIKGQLNGVECKPAASSS